MGRSNVSLGGKLSPRDLPVWSRGVAAGLTLLAAWHIPRTEQLVTFMGYSALEISTGVVAVAILLGMGLPLALWPQYPARDRFSQLAALTVAVVLGVLMIASGPSDLPASMVETEKGLAVAVIVGSAVWSLAWGQVHHRMVLRWYGMAALAAIAPVLIGLITMAAQDGGLPPLQTDVLLPVAAFFLVVGTTGALVTQELAFRRVLIGQAGDAGLATVLVAAVLFGAWNVVAPDPPGGVLQAAVLGSLRGIVLGSLYSLSRSLLVPALCHGAWLAAIRSIAAATTTTGEGQALEDRMTSVIVATAVAAVVLAYQVYRRSGFAGILARRA